MLKHGKQLQKNIINKLNVEIDFLSKQLEEKHSIYRNEIRIKRDELFKKINKISEKDNVSGKNLNLQFEYYCVMIENMTLGHLKKKNFNDLMKKNFQINKLVSQIKIRDNIIETANNEMMKKKIVIEISPNINDLRDLDIEQSLVLPVIVNKSMINNKEINNNLKVSDHSQRQNKLQSPLPLINNYNIPYSPKRIKSPSPSPSI